MRNFRVAEQDLRGGDLLRYLRINKRNVQFHAKAALSKIVYCDGMPRSGSTLLFNIMRHVLLSDPDCRLSSGWVRQARHLPRAPIYLVKTHGLYPIDAWRAWRIAYSYRDPRDALVSAQRKFGDVPSISTLRKWVQDFAFAKKNANLMIRYETLIEDVPGTVTRIADLLERPVDVQKIIDDLPSDGQATDFPDQITLYHANHRTRTAKGEWRTILSPELQSQIKAEFGSWLEENGYGCC